MPDRFALHANYPNPFNPTTQIRYDLPRTAAVRLDIYDVQGRHVRVLVQAEQPAGTYRIAWDGRDAAGLPVASGAYVYRLQAGSFTAARTTVLLR